MKLLDRVGFVSPASALPLCSLLVPVFFLAVGCSSNANKPKEISTTLEASSYTPVGSVGLNKDGEAIVQQERSASVELDTLQHVNENLHMDLNSEIFDLKRCRKELNRSTNGGDGQYPVVTDMKKLQAVEKSREEFGIEKGQIKLVKKEMLVEKIKAQREYQSELNELIAVVKDQRDKCDFKLANSAKASGETQADSE